jgi:hypothetical protein
VATFATCSANEVEVVAAITGATAEADASGTGARA